LPFLYTYNSAFKMNPSSNSRSYHAESSRMASSMDQQHQFNMENAAAEASLAYETRDVVEKIRPRNTIYAYLPKQKKFQVHKMSIYSHILRTNTRGFIISFLELVRRKTLSKRHCIRNEDCSLRERVIRQRNCLFHGKRQWYNEHCTPWIQSRDIKDAHKSTCGPLHCTKNQF